MMSAMGKSRKNDESSAGLVVGLIAFSLVVMFWQWILLGIILWILVRILWMVHIGKDAEPVRTKPVSWGVTESGAKPKLMPAPDYVPRWTVTRRSYTDREHGDWQKQFDSVA